MEIVYPIAALVIAAVILLMPLLLLAGYVRRQVRRRGRTTSAALLAPGTLAGLVVVALIYAAGTYGWGTLSSFYLLDPDQMCASAAGFYSGTPGPADELWTGIIAHDLPLQRTCAWSDGTRFELVPWWVNPLFFAWLTIAAGALLAAPAARYVDRLERAQTI
ncbi:hypothetical protein [Catenuloplanes japonicus]|uniref:hypothetical protein n=1 Tax=Catenuloplanes japonicus TaxID=33876 RepID=UPI00068EBD3D|nr:hypothetical protein [Catenuloplanes japonicus]